MCFSHSVVSRPNQVTMLLIISCEATIIDPTSNVHNRRRTALNVTDVQDLGPLRILTFKKISNGVKLSP